VKTSSAASSRSGEDTFLHHLAGARGELEEGGTGLAARMPTSSDGSRARRPPATRCWSPAFEDDRVGIDEDCVIGAARLRLASAAMLTA